MAKFIKQNIDDVNNLTSLLEYYHSKWGLAKPYTIAEKSANKEILEWFWENFPEADWKSLIDLMEYSRKSGFKPRSLHALIKYKAQEAHDAGVFVKVDPAVLALETNWEAALQEVGKLQEGDYEYWSARFEQSLGNYRATTLREFNNWKKTQ